MNSMIILTFFIEFVERAAGFDEFARTRQDLGLRRQNHRGDVPTWLAEVPHRRRPRVAREVATVFRASGLAAAKKRHGRDHSALAEGAP